MWEDVATSMKMIPPYPQTLSQRCATCESYSGLTLCQAFGRPLLVWTSGHGLAVSAVLSGILGHCITTLLPKCSFTWEHWWIAVLSMPLASRDTWFRNEIYDVGQHEGHGYQVCSAFIIHCLVTDKWKLLNGLLKEGGLSKVLGICQVQQLRPRTAYRATVYYNYWCAIMWLEINPCHAISF